MKYIQVIISIMLIIFVFRKADINRFIDSFGDVEFPLVVLMILIFALQIFLNVCRFKIVLLIFGITTKFSQIFKLYINSLFAGLILFGSIGELVAKTYQLKKHNVKLKQNISAQVIDKAMALLGLLTVALICMAGLQNEFANIVGISLSDAFYFSSLIVFSCLIIIYIASFKYRKIKLYAKSFYGLFFTKKSVLCLILSIISHSLSIVIAAASFSSIGISIFKQKVAVFSVPIINAISAFPLFFNGWGIREVLWQTLLVRLGYESEQAMLGSLIIGLGLPVTVLIIYFMNLLISKFNFSIKSL